MNLYGCKKVENEAGYPYYIDEATGNQQYDHPEFRKIMESLEEYDGIKYSTYRVAFKIFSLQKHLRVPPLRISAGVFSRHQLSLSESSLSLDTAELEAVLADIYFAAEKEGLYSGDVDLSVDLLINLLLNVYDRDRKDPVRVLAAKTLLIILSEESVSEKWAALANCCADHNGCVSPKRLAALLSHVVALPAYFQANAVQIQQDVDSCFEKSAGMLGVSARTVAEWGLQNCNSTKWLSVVSRVVASRNCANATASCAACNQPLIQVLKFKCLKCRDKYFCEKCYLYDKDLTKVRGHKKSHLIHEIVDGQMKSSECLSFIRGMKRFFFCTKTKQRKPRKKLSKKPEREKVNERKGSGIVTSTVGKASGKKEKNPIYVLQDVIAQLENQHVTLKELSSQLHDASKESEDSLKIKVDTHLNQLTAQINRLKIVKDTLSRSDQDLATSNQQSKEAFDLISPILLIKEQELKINENPKNQPRVLSLDSGNFSVASKQAESQNLLTMSGDALKPIVVHATSDSISSVSMNDISNWYNEADPTAPTQSKQRSSEQSKLSAEQKFAADIQSVETSNDNMKELYTNMDTVLDRLQQILTDNFAMDESCFDNTQLRETANEMEGLLGTLIRGVEQKATLNANRGSL